MKFKRLYIAAILAGSLGLTSCSDSFLDAKQTEYETDADLGTDSPAIRIAYMRGVHYYMVKFGAAETTSHDDFGIMTLLHCSDMNVDDVVLVNNGSGWFMYDQDLSNNIENYRRPKLNWLTPYSMIAMCNRFLERLDPETTDPLDLSYLGECHAIRAMSYYYLINFFQHTYDAWEGENGNLPGVPIIRRESEGGPILGRSTVKDVLNYIQSEFETSLSYYDKIDYTKWSASDAIGADYKTFVDKFVANGLAARFYLMTQQWDKAQKAAEIALQQPNLTLMTSDEYAAGFSDINNKEWMWGMRMTGVNTTVYASFFSHISNVSPGYAGIGAYRAMNNWLYEQMDDKDLRKNVFEPKKVLNGSGVMVANPDSLLNLKFGYVSNFENDIPYMRAAEMYLIQAEAYARQGNESMAGQLLNQLLTKRYSSDPGMTSATVDEVMIQRRIELWGEGFGLFDCKRTNRPITRGYEGSNFQVPYQYNAAIQNDAFNLQIPLVEINENDGLNSGDQNPYPPLLTPWSEDEPWFNNADGTVTK